MLTFKKYKLINKIFQKQNDTKSIPRTSIDFVLDSAEQMLIKNQNRKKKAAPTDEFAVPLKITRSTRSNRQKTVLGVSQGDNLPPPSTARRGRPKKIVSFLYMIIYSKDSFLVFVLFHDIKIICVFLHH